MARLKIFKNISELVTLRSAAKKKGRSVLTKDLSIVKSAALISYAGRIVWYGKEMSLTTQKLNALYSELNLNKKNIKIKEYDLKRASLLPGFVEAHTHLVFAGNRSDEFEQRISGMTYQQIANKGGGILSTVKATRKSSFEELLKLSQKRVNRFKEQGVVALEVKSGYGLNFINEKKMLEVARSLKGVRVLTTYLAAHAKPKEFMTSQQYVDHIILKDLPRIIKNKLADRVDIFVEDNYFSLADAQKLFSAAEDYGLGITAHVEQLTRQGGGLLAVNNGAISIDHLVHLSNSDIATIANSSTTCVLLPGADFYLNIKYPKARDLLDAGARVALATDFNPGSCPTQDLSLIGFLARNKMKMSLAEVLTAYTLNGAYALGIEQEYGSIEKGKRAEFALVQGSWKDLFYQVGEHPVQVLK